VSIFTIDANSEDEIAYGVAGGWRLGYEYYFTPNVALRLENTLTISDGFEDTVAVSNTFSVGTRLLF
jgi:hypothetical protein